MCIYTKIGAEAPILAIGLQGATLGFGSSGHCVVTVVCSYSFASFTEIAYRVVHILTHCPVETWSSPSKAHQPGQLSYRILYDVLLVDPVGIEPTSRTPFIQLHTTILLTAHSIADTVHSCDPVP